jgi:hypothetical protein
LITDLRRGYLMNNNTVAFKAAGGFDQTVEMASDFDPAAYHPDRADRENGIFFFIQARQFGIDKNISPLLNRQI